MKITVALAVALMSPALENAALAASPADQTRQAQAMFYAGQSSAVDFATDQVDILLDGAEGVWLSLPLEYRSDGIENDLETNCPRVGLRLARTSKYAFTMTQTFAGKQVVHAYVSMGGATFSVQVSPEQLLAGLAPEGFDGIKVNLLRQSNGIATIVRPSPDVLVVQTNSAVPVIFTRCPEPG